jgi:hypothetical protein
VDSAQREFSAEENEQLVNPQTATRDSDPG